jgi:hypothetical protein
MNPESSDEAAPAADNVGSAFAASAFNERTELSSFDPDKPPRDRGE